MNEPTSNCAGRWARWTAGALLVMGAGSVMGQVTVGAGSVVNVGSGSMQGGCADLQVDGQLLLGSGQTTGWNNLAIGAAGQVNGGSGLISLSGNFAKVTAVKAFDDTQFKDRPMTARARRLYWDWAATAR